MTQTVRLYIILGFLGFLCGCETTGAFGTGRITNTDVNYIIQEGTIGRRYARVDVATITPDEDYDLDTLPASSLEQTFSDLYYADSWLEDNLW